MIVTSSAIVICFVVQGQAGKEMVSMTMIILTVSLVFLVLTSPAGAFYIMESRLIEGILTLEDNARYVLFYTVVNLLVYFNSAINFLLYVLTGRKFREELFKMFGKGNKVGAATTIGTAG